MTRNARPHTNGFTVIELVMAIAIAVVLIAAVSSVTRALTETALRQRELSVQVLRREKCSDILRRDLRGWVLQSSSTAPVISSNSTPSRKPGDDPPVLQFNTLADGLSSSLSNIGNGARAVSNVQYFIRKSAAGYDFVRVESGTDGQCFELLLMQSAEPPRVEFYAGNDWLDTWDFSKRPTAVRVTIGKFVIETFLG